MSALKRQLVRGLCACVVLALASCRAPVDASGEAYRAWLAERVHAAESSMESRDAALAAALRQHLCDADRACFPQTAWQEFDFRASTSHDPVILSLMTSIDALRNDQHSNAKRWAHVADLDRGNAYPIVMQAAAQWQAGHHSDALDTLRTALGLPRYEDQNAGTAKLLFPIVDARPPSLEQMHPCTFFTPPGSVPSELERRSSAAFEIAVDFAPAPLGDMVELCEQIDPELEATQHELCQAIGVQIERRATTVLSRAIGFGLQRLGSTDENEKEAIAARQYAAMDDFLRKTWWIEVNPDAKARDAAGKYWFDQFLQGGELAATDALVQHFGEPPHESAEDRRRRFDARMQQGQQCYARYNARYRHDPK